MLGDAEDSVRPPGVLADELDIVAADLGIRHLRVLQEEEVVHRDDEPPGPARHDEGMGRVHEVQRCLCQALQGRPSESVPGEVEGPDGESPIHQSHIRGPGARWITISEGRREEDELVLGGGGGQTFGQGQDVGADACGPDEGRSQVEPESHGVPR